MGEQWRGGQALKPPEVARWATTDRAPVPLGRCRAAIVARAPGTPREATRSSSAGRFLSREPRGGIVYRRWTLFLFSSFLEVALKFFYEEHPLVYKMARQMGYGLKMIVMTKAAARRGRSLRERNEEKKATM